MTSTHTDRTTRNAMTDVLSKSELQTRARSDRYQRVRSDARKDGVRRPLWPMIIMRTPKGWTCPKEIDGKKTEDYWRSHQVPMGEMHQNTSHIKILEDWMKSYRPDELFDENGALKPNLLAFAPTGERRMSANPHANGGLLLEELRMPDFRS